MLLLLLMQVCPATSLTGVPGLSQAGRLTLARPDSILRTPTAPNE